MFHALTITYTRKNIIIIPIVISEWVEVTLKIKKVIGEDNIAQSMESNIHLEIDM